MKRKERRPARRQQRRPKRPAPKPNRPAPNPHRPAPTRTSKNPSAFPRRSSVSSGRCRVARRHGRRCLASPAPQTSSLVPARRIALQLLNSFQYITPVKGVALGGDEASVGDDVAEVPFVGGSFHASGKDDVFFGEDSADVVGAELQTYLADF